MGAVAPATYHSSQSRMRTPPAAPSHPNPSKYTSWAATTTTTVTSASSGAGSSMAAVTQSGLTTHSTRLKVPSRSGVPVLLVLVQVPLRQQFLCYAFNKAERSSPASTS